MLNDIVIGMTHLTDSQESVWLCLLKQLFKIGYQASVSDPGLRQNQTPKRRDAVKFPKNNLNSFTS